ncbi:Uncharacterized protein APZ42_006560, partial [Daphnia magna]
EDPKDFDYIGNAILYGFIIYKCDAFYIYSGTRADETYVVSIDIDDVPVGHHDVPCQNPRALH